MSRLIAVLAMAGSLFALSACANTQASGFVPAQSGGATTPQEGAHSSD